MLFFTICLSLTCLAWIFQSPLQRRWRPWGCPTLPETPSPRQVWQTSSSRQTWRSENNLCLEKSILTMHQWRAAPVTQRGIWDHVCQPSLWASPCEWRQGTPPKRRQQPKEIKVYQYIPLPLPFHCLCNSHESNVTLDKLSYLFGLLMFPCGGLLPRKLSQLLRVSPVHECVLITHLVLWRRFLGIYFVRHFFVFLCRRRGLEKRGGHCLVKRKTNLRAKAKINKNLSWTCNGGNALDKKWDCVLSTDAIKAAH